MSPWRCDVVKRAVCASLPLLQYTFTHSSAGLISPGPLPVELDPSWTLGFFLPLCWVPDTDMCLCGLEGIMNVPICLDLAEAHRCFGQVFAIVFSPFSLRSPLHLLWRSGLTLQQLGGCPCLGGGWGWLCPPAP